MRNQWKVLLSVGALAFAMGHAHADDKAQLIKRGEYLAIAGDCAACHSVKDRAPFSGGHPINSPLGTIYSTNITPSKTAGIGNYSQEQFSAALRRGVRGDGSQLYPAMPYTAYAKLNDDDVAALYAYFMQGVQPDDSSPQKTALPFPFNLRISMMAWNWLFLDKTPFQPDATKSVEWNRGAYLAQGLAHCSTCHTPRNFLMAEQAGKNLQGASLGTWFAPDITATTLQGKPQWTRQMLADYLATGHADNGATAGGPMLEAIEKSFSRMTQEDLKAIATYLLPVEGTSQAPTTAALAKPIGLTPVQGDDTPQTLAGLNLGAQLYRNNCASCHNVSGLGLNGLPPLQDHPVLKKPNADNVAMAVLEGVLPEKGQGMIGFAETLDDKQIAALTNYVMQDLGKSAVSISVERVKELRAGGAASPLMLMSRIGMAVFAVVLVLVAALWLRRRRNKKR